MKIKYTIVTAILGLVTASANAATSFTDDFANGTFPDTNLTSAAPADWTESGGVIKSVSNTRGFVATVDTDYNTVDFIYEITVANQGSRTFFGIFDAVAGPTSFGAPTGDSIYIETLNDSIKIAGGDGGTGLVTQQADYADPVLGSTRLRMTKTGNNVQFFTDTEYTGGPFSADTTSDVFDLTTVTPTLDNTNARLFFGGDHQYEWDDMSVTVVPEPSSLGLIALGMMGIVIRRRKK